MLFWFLKNCTTSRQTHWVQVDLLQQNFPDILQAIVTVHFWKKNSGTKWNKWNNITFYHTHSHYIFLFFRFYNNLIFLINFVFLISLKESFNETGKFSTLSFSSSLRRASKQGYRYLWVMAPKEKCISIITKTFIYKYLSHNKNGRVSGGQVGLFCFLVTTLRFYKTTACFYILLDPLLLFILIKHKEFSHLNLKNKTRKENTFTNILKTFFVQRLLNRKLYRKSSCSVNLFK